MSRQPSAKIDRVSIERATYHAQQQREHVLARAVIYQNDPERTARLEAAECLACHGTGRVGGSVCCERPCPICGARITSGNTNIDVLCRTCAKANGLCKHCGGDVEMRIRRKARPYETLPKPETCPHCREPMAADLEFCSACKRRKMEPCCECGDDYPAKDLLDDGEIYCPKCRK